MEAVVKMSRFLLKFIFPEECQYISLICDDINGVCLEEVQHVLHTLTHTSPEFSNIIDCDVHMFAKKGNQSWYWKCSCSGCGNEVLHRAEKLSEEILLDNSLNLEHDRIECASVIYLKASSSSMAAACGSHYDPAMPWHVYLGEVQALTSPED